MTHGTGRDCYFLILVTVTEEEVAELREKTGEDPTVISFGKRTTIPLQLEEEKKPGQIESKLYDTNKKTWKSTIAVRRYR